MENYWQKDHIFIKKDSYSFLSEIDTIIFDIDGVLINVNGSFYQTIIDTVQYYFHHILNIPGEEELMDRNTILSFKMIGGFNDDWELAAAAILYYLWKMQEYEKVSMEELKRSHPSIDFFINKNLSNGGGLSQLIKWVKENSSNSEKIFSLWNREKIFQVGKELYAGERHCHRLYSLRPQNIAQSEGYIEREHMIINSEVTKIIKRYQVGILTGRNRNEARFTLEQIGWDAWIQPISVITSEDYPRKPSPEGLHFLFQYYKSKRGLYIGDTMDDLLTVKNLNRYQGEGGQRCLSALVLESQDLEENDLKKHYMDHKADVIAENVNQVVQLIHCRARSNYGFHNKRKGGK